MYIHMLIMKLHLMLTDRIMVKSRDYLSRKTPSILREVTCR